MSNKASSAWRIALVLGAACLVFGGLFVRLGWGYAPLWTLNLALTAFAATCAYCIRAKRS